MDRIKLHTLDWPQGGEKCSNTKKLFLSASEVLVKSSNIVYQIELIIKLQSVYQT